MELFQASTQWANRPADQRFASLEALYNATFGYYQQRSEVPVMLKGLQADEQNGEVILSAGKNAARFTHYGFGQFCGLLKVSKALPTGEVISATAPPTYMRALHPKLAALNINYGLACAPDKQVQILFHKDGRPGAGQSPLLLRACTSDQYNRYWNYNVAKFLQSLPQGWRVPPARPSSTSDPMTIRPANQSDLIDCGKFGLSIRLGDPIAPAGIYASDHDLFVFMINENRALKAGTQGQLNRGFFVTNDEVGSGSLRFTCFLYDTGCGNHIVWGAQKVVEVRLRHVGENLQHRIAGAVCEMVKFTERPAADDEARIRAARSKILGQTRDQVIELVCEKQEWVPKRRAEEAYKLAEQYTDAHGDPRSAWGYMSALTRLSQQSPFADTRDGLDRAARKVLEYAFV